MADRLLVNYWYAPAVGHAVEALRYALGYASANPEAKVSVLLNAGTTTELAHCCPFIDRVFPVPFVGFARPEGDARAALAAVPREWDWVIDNYRVGERSHDRIAGFRKFYSAAREHFRPTRGFGITGDEPPPYAPHRRLRLELPEEARHAARQRVAGQPHALSVILAGHSDSRAFYPSVASWEMILDALAARYPDAAILLIGKLAAGSATSSSAISRAEVDRLLASCPAAVDCFDQPLLEQAALVEASDVFLSPHTGFGFVALAVGTPWLTLSGGNWHEYFFNGVPFYSVVPDTRRYPSFTWDERMMPVEDEDGEGPRTPSMSRARIREDLPELVHAAELLIGRRLDYPAALARYFPRLLDAYDGDATRIFTFDNIHLQFLPSSGDACDSRESPTAKVILPPDLGSHPSRHLHRLRRIASSFAQRLKHR